MHTETIEICRKRALGKSREVTVHLQKGRFFEKGRYFCCGTSRSSDTRFFVVMRPLNGLRYTADPDTTVIM